MIFVLTIVLSTACGDCGMGQWVCGQGCVYPTIANYDLTNGLAPGDTGSRQTFSPSSYAGTDNQMVQAAVAAAAAVGGAVVLDRVYEVSTGIFLQGFGDRTIMLTGGGLRRVCSPNQTLTAPVSASDTCVNVADGTAYTVGYSAGVFSGEAWNQLAGSWTISSVSATQVCKSSQLGFTADAGATLGYRSNLVTTIPTVSSGVVIDSVLFDGANDCNDHTHDWTLNNAISIRGENIIRNSVFYDSPSETITSCGADILNNRAFDLQGSFVHKSCSTGGPQEVIANNYVDNANIAGDAVMEHSEGIITFSANAGNMMLWGNRFRRGGEGVFGLASVDDEEVHVSSDCYAQVPDSLITVYSGGDAGTFTFDSTCMFNVGPVIIQ